MSNRVDIVKNSDDTWTLTIHNLKTGNEFITRGPSRVAVIQSGLEMAADRINMLSNLIDELKDKL